MAGDKGEKGEDNVQRERYVDIFQSRRKLDRKASRLLC